MFAREPESYTGGYYKCKWNQMSYYVVKSSIDSILKLKFATKLWRLLLLLMNYIVYTSAIIL